MLILLDKFVFGFSHCPVDLKGGVLTKQIFHSCWPKKGTRIFSFLLFFGLGLFFFFFDTNKGKLGNPLLQNEAWAFGKSMWLMAWRAFLENR
jgi:hypothetical protein